MNRNITSVFAVTLHFRDGEMVVSGNSESLKMVAVNLSDGSDDENKPIIISMAGELDISRLYETIGKMLGK